MSMRFNQPPGWPAAPPGWVPPPGWQPDPSWPDPPPGWQLWVEDPATRKWQLRAATWTMAGGGAAFIGALLPFLSSSQPDVVEVNATPQDTATMFGLILFGLGIIMRARSRRPRRISAIVALIIACMTALEFVVFIAGGLVGTDESDPFGSTVHVNFTPGIGIFLAILGCAAAGIGAIMSFRRR